MHGDLIRILKCLKSKYFINFGNDRGNKQEIKRKKPRGGDLVGLSTAM